MRVFVEVVDCGSLTAAAERLSLSRAMASRYLADLEKWAGARLLHRTTRRLSLTPAGSEALPRCRQAIEIAQEIRAGALDRQDEPRGLIRIAASMSFGQAFLARVVSDYVRRYPATQIDLVLGNAPVNLVQERIDLAVRITNNLDPNLIARRLASCRSVICASPAYLNQHGIPRNAEELARHNCLTYAYFGNSVWQFQRDGQPVSIPVRGNISANEPTALMSASLAGAGISLQPLYSAAPFLKSGRLVALLGDYEPEQLGIHAIYTSRRQMPATLRTLLDFLAARFAAERDWEWVTRDSAPATSEISFASGI
jgi:DNA-binding transcriptional LysR family regulator